MDYFGVPYLRMKLERKQDRVKLRYRYYEMKDHHTDKARMLPVWLDGSYEATLGWCTKAVDSLADRLVFKGFAGDTDYVNSMAIFEANNGSVLFGAAIREALIASCSFIAITHGKEPGDLPRLSVITARDATGIMDEQTGFLKEGYAVLERDKDDKPIREAYYTAEHTEYSERGKTTVIEENPTGIPLLIPVVYKPDSTRPFGHSRISRACMYYQSYAANTMRRSEVSAEFYSFPQRYASGTDPEADPIDSWKATISTMLSFTKDEDGDRPTLGSFTQQSMTPFLDQLKTAASMFAGETGLTMDDLGFPSDIPSSAEAIKSAHESLRVMIVAAQTYFGQAFIRAGWLAAKLRDGIDYLPTVMEDMSPLWKPAFDVDASTLGAVGDSVLKLNQAVPNLLDTDAIYKLTGIEPSDAVDVEEATEEVLNE